MFEFTPILLRKSDSHMFLHRKNQLLSWCNCREILNAQFNLVFLLKGFYIKTSLYLDLDLESKTVVVFLQL